MHEVRDHRAGEHHARTAAEALQHAGHDEHRGGRGHRRQHGSQQSEKGAGDKEALAPDGIRERAHDELAHAHADEEARDGQLHHGPGGAQFGDDLRHHRQVHISSEGRCCGQQRQRRQKRKRDHASRCSSTITPRIHSTPAHPKKTRASNPIELHGAFSST